MSASNLKICVDEVTTEGWLSSIKDGSVSEATLQELQVYGSEKVRKAATEALEGEYVPADDKLEVEGDTDFYKVGGTD